MVQGKPQLNLKEIHAITSEIIDATEGRTDDGRCSIPLYEKQNYIILCCS